MYKYLLAATVGVCVVMECIAASPADETPEFKAYASFGFGGSQSQSLGLHYGLRVDHDRRVASLFGKQKPSIVQMDFSVKSGLENASIYGMPLTGMYSMMLNATDKKDDGCESMCAWFWLGSIAGTAALGGLIYGISQLTSNNNSAVSPAVGLQCIGGQVPVNGVCQCPANTQFNVQDQQCEG